MIRIQVVRAALLLGVALVHLLPSGVRGQAPPPDADWRTLRTEHFRVTYTPELDPIARHAAMVAERTYAILSAELTEPPAGMIDLVVTDHVDYTNGFARPFFSNRVVVYARPPAGGEGLAYTRDWIELVVAHELVHIFHLDITTPLGAVVRGVFGRVPGFWPLFPAVATPNWSVEGLATYYESRLTGAGRVHGSYHDMIIRTAALEDRIPDLDVLSAPTPVWPGGTRAYAYGAELMTHIADRFGPDAHRRILEATSGSIRPTFLLFDHVAEDAVGMAFDEIYADWRSAATDSALAAAAAVMERGVTETAPLVRAGPYARSPRVSPDGRTLSYAAHDYRSDPATRLLELPTGEVRTLARRNQFGGLLGPAAWLPDGSGMVVAQLELRGRYRAWSDLWLVDLDGREERLTDGKRLAQPDVSPDGRHVAAVRNGAGAIDLVIHDLVTGQTRTLAKSTAGDAFDAPRWNPDGSRIAAARHRAGQVDIVVVDGATGQVSPITDDRALDTTPTWTPDGRWLLWSSDRSGIPNLYAAEPSPGAEAWQVTNVLTGAFDPEVSPDGNTLYTAVYHYDGWAIEQAPLDTATWTPAPPDVMAYRPGLLAEPDPDRTVAGDAESYDPLPTLRPWFWGPVFDGVGARTAPGSMFFAGAYVTGEDVLARHSWEATAAVDVGGTGRLQGRMAWTYRGMGAPEISVSASRDWTGRGAVTLTEGRETIYLRTDRVALGALLWRPRWRSTVWLRGAVDVEREELVAHALSTAELAEEDIALRDLPTTVGLSVGPGYSSARWHPLSISAEDGVSASGGFGRWWDIEAGSYAYDQVLGRVAGYLAVPLGGFANHVLAARLSGLVRDGAAASAVSIGGVPGLSPDVVVGGGGGGTFLPARGYDHGVRSGTRAWSASGEWRLPLHLRHAPTPGVLGFSLTSISGAVFADAAAAWCTAAERERGGYSGCSATTDPLISVGAELSLDVGLFHNSRTLVRFGLAVPLTGGEEKAAPFYLALGPSF